MSKKILFFVLLLLGACSNQPSLYEQNLREAKNASE